MNDISYHDKRIYIATTRNLCDIFGTFQKRKRWVYQLPVYRFIKPEVVEVSNRHKRATRAGVERSAAQGNCEKRDPGSQPRRIHSPFYMQTYDIMATAGRCCIISGQDPVTRTSTRSKLIFLRHHVTTESTTQQLSGLRVHEKYHLHPFLSGD